MTPNQKNPDITVRGGLINVPNSAKPHRPPRHQPDTPVNKKAAKTKTDHKPYIPESDPVPTEAPPEPDPVHTEAPPEPEGPTDHVPAKTSQSD